jgi:hypothetical protein
MTDKKDLKVEFAPGCFDQFEGTQEELDQMILDIQLAIESGELFDGSEELTDEEFDELPEEAKEQIIRSLNDAFGDKTPPRNLQ